MGPIATPVRRPPKAVRVLRALNYIVRSNLGLPARLDTVDRQVLERTILPAYAARTDLGRVLFVGCAPFTRHYAAFFAGKSFTTIDPDPRVRRCGAAHHIVDRLEHLDRHLAAGSLDLILCNGVFGWGLDERTDCEAAFDACARALRADGELLVGWNDVDAHRPFPLESLAALTRFRPIMFAPLGASRYLTDTRNRHTYDFFLRR